MIDTPFSVESPLGSEDVELNSECDCSLRKSQKNQEISRKCGFLVYAQ